MKKRKKKPKRGPVRLPDAQDWGSRWDSARQHYWDETKHQCDECLEKFGTSAIVYVFGDMDTAIAQKFYLCVVCGYMAFHSGSFPAATVIYISEAHRSLRFLDLDEGHRGLVIDSFRQVDQIHQRVAELALRYGSATSPKPADQEPN